MNKQASYGVGAIISNDKGEILMLNHKKLGVWTIPMGKVEPDETPNDAIIRELFEELGIKSIEHLHTIKDVEYSYSDQGEEIDIVANVYIICLYEGVPFNKEPDKHHELKYMPIKEVYNLGYEGMVSEMTKIFLDHTEM